MRAGCVNILASTFDHRTLPSAHSNWRGPVWVNANAVLAYGLRRYGYLDEALMVFVGPRGRCHQQLIAVAMVML